MDKKCECPGERHQQEDQTRIQRQQKNKKHDTVQRILQQFKRNPKDRKYQDKKERFLITRMRNEVGDIEASRRGVANTFAKFYEDLYSGRNDESKRRQGHHAILLKMENGNSEQEKYNMVSKNEKHDDQEKQRLEITRLKKGNLWASKGVKARDLKWTDEKTTEWMRCIINVIIKQDSMTPSSWKKVTIKVLYTRKAIR